jgi:hypothetical protein
VSIQYATADGTATASGDYTSRTGTLTWAAGDNTEKTITVPVTNDTQNEPDETFTIALSNAGGGAGIEGSPTYTVTLGNDDVAANPPPAPMPSGGGGGGGGGGGAIDPELLLLLAALGAIRFSYSASSGRRFRLQ